MKQKKIGRPKNAEEYVKIGTLIHKPLNDDIDRYCKENCIIKSRFIEKALEQYMLLKINEKA